jgi:hypothetical protein
MNVPGALMTRGIAMNAIPLFDVFWLMFSGEVTWRLVSQSESPRDGRREFAKPGLQSYLHGSYRIIRGARPRELRFTQLARRVPLAERRE